MMMRRTSLFFLSILLNLASGLAFGQGGNQSVSPAKEPAPSVNTAPPVSSPDSSALGVMLSSDEIRQLIRQVAEKDIENDKRQRDNTRSGLIRKRKSATSDGSLCAKSTTPTTSG